MRLTKLLDGLDLVSSERDPGPVEVTSVVHHSAAVTPGALFCCVAGTAVDGHALAPAAVEAGAVALLCERHVAADVPQVRVVDVRAAMGVVAASFHGHPSDSLDVIGITGTNGKTTTAHLLAAILEADGRQTGIIGNLTAGVGGPPNTPEGPELQARLAALRDSGARAVAMEVSSHALNLGRVRGTRFRLAVFTNLSPEHLDHHGTMEAYFAAKAKLFEPALSDRAVVNLDDPRGRLLRDAAVVPTEGYTLDDALDVEADLSGTGFTWRGQRLHVSLPGEPNLANALAAATSAAALGVGVDAVAAGLAEVRAVPGRFEVVAPESSVAVVVDYAHTPDGLRQLLLAVRSLMPVRGSGGGGGGGGRIHLVFGCGGDRDRSKRPVMGELAARLADHVVVTSDNPRSEDPERIIDEVASGAREVPGAGPVERQTDRRVAIQLALRAAAPGDVVIVAGKGHETTQTVGTEITPFDDRLVAAELLAALRLASP